MTLGERWLRTLWPLVRTRLPATPARVIDLGCGPHGGFVPMLLANGYDAIGVDPNAPDEPHYRRIEFEHAELPRHVDAVVASTSLHHVANPATVIDRNHRHAEKRRRTRRRGMGLGGLRRTNR